jgi:small subunit ribosomal protein S21
MVYVKVVDGNYEKALRIFKKKVKDSGLLHELQENRFYKKPSAEKRERCAKGRLRAQLKSKKANK